MEQGDFLIHQNLIDSNNKKSVFTASTISPILEAPVDNNIFLPVLATFLSNG